MVRALVRLLIGPLPAWTQRGDPLLRYQLGPAAARLPWRWRYLRALGVVLAGGLLLLTGVLIATNLLRQPAGQTIPEIVNAVAFWPLIALQLALSVAALTSTTTFVSDELRRQSWDNLRTTEHGTEFAMRARWAAVFYRLRGLLGVTLALRALLIGLLLWELTAFQGRYLDLLINGVTPDVPLLAAVLLVALTLTAALLLPLTTLGLDAATGLLVSAVVRTRTASTLLQAVLISLRVVVTGLLLLGARLWLEGQLLAAADVPAWLLLETYGAVGDLGLALLQLGRSSEIWARVPYGIFLGLGLVAFALLEAAAADRILRLAARQAQQHG